MFPPLKACCVLVASVALLFTCQPILHRRLQASIERMSTSIQHTPKNELDRFCFGPGAGVNDLRLHLSPLPLDQVKTMLTRLGSWFRVRRLLPLS